MPRASYGFIQPALVLGFVLAVGDAAPAADAPRFRAAIVTVQEYNDKSLKLNFTLNDGKRLREILMDRGGVPSNRILEMTDASPEDYRPTRTNVSRHLQIFLARAGPDDRVLIFFSGHGVPHKDSRTSEVRTFLALRDFDRMSPEKTGIPVGELRQWLADCKAGVKFLILDCCHAGNDKSGLVSSLPAEDVARAVLKGKGLPGGVILASCAHDEKSGEWPERQHGIFSYWLCRALEGGAANERGEVTVTEVNRYLHQRVTRTAEQVSTGTQTPVLAGKLEGDPVLLTLRPEPPESLCRRLAEHLDLEIRRKRMDRVGVVEFTLAQGEVERLVAANLPAVCAEQVRGALTTLAGTHYKVIDADTMKRAAQQLKAADLGFRAGLKRLADAAGGLDGVVIGSLNPSDDQLTLQCRLRGLADAREVAQVSGQLPVSEDMLGDLGCSFDNRKRPAGGPYAAEVVKHAREASGNAHPLLNDEFPFRVEVWSIQAKPGEKITPDTPRKEKKLIQVPVTGPDGRKRNELVIPATKDELFEIRLVNGTKDTVACQLLVDGINTLGQRRELLGKGRAWVLGPNGKGLPFWQIEGWFPDAKGGHGGERTEEKMLRFRFVDTPESVAGRQKFGEKLGLITAAFYAEQGRAVDVGEGPEERRVLETVGFKPGRELAVVQIRYVDKRDLDR